MKKTLLLSATAALSAMMAVSAIAADLPVRRPVYKSAPVMTYSWTGCYVGGNVGGLWANKEWFDGNPLDPTFGQSAGSHDVNGWLGGVQVGCNYQVGAWVFGIQGDYDWTNANGSNANLLAPPGFTDSTKIKSLASVTGRVGYAWDRFLGYVKGGGAWERDEYSITAPFGVFATGSETRTGWTVGIGGEYAFTNNLTGFIEYDWYSFGAHLVPLATVFGNTALANIQDSKGVLKVGLNWKFGGPFAPY